MISRVDFRICHITLTKLLIQEAEELEHLFQIFILKS